MSRKGRQPMGILNAIGLRLAAVCMLLGPPAAQAKLYLDGPDKWSPDQTITFRLFADTDTVVLTFGFGNEALGEVYEKFASVLVLQPNPVVADFIKTGIGECNTEGSACSYAYFDENFEPAPLTIPAGTVVTWEFWVRDDAKPESLDFVFDLKAEAVMDPLGIEPEPIGWITPMEFEVLQAIPESSSWMLMTIGLVAVGARAYSRRMA